MAGIEKWFRSLRQGLRASRPENDGVLPDRQDPDVTSDDAPHVGTVPMPGSDRTAELRLVPTWDGLYTPAAVCLPPGDGPHPVVVLAYGNGGGGLPWVREAVRRRDLVAERLLDCGYGAVWIDYRTEVELGYARGGPLLRDVRSGGELFSRSPLEFEDERAVVEYLAARTDVDGDRIAAIGCSHAAEMLLKLASGWNGLAAAVVAEPASHEFLALRRRDDEDVEQLEGSDAAAVRRRMDLPLATERAAAIATPLLVMGRDDDPLQEVFRATYDLLVEVGADVRWTSYDSPEHGYVVPERTADGTWADREGSLAAIGEAIAFLAGHLAR
jgi:dienelactone hydrolase